MCVPSQTMSSTFTTKIMLLILKRGKRLNYLLKPSRFSIYFGKSKIFVKSSGYTTGYIPYFSIKNSFIGELFRPYGIYTNNQAASRVGLGDFTMSNLNKVNQKLRLIHRRFLQTYT